MTSYLVSDGPVVTQQRRAGVVVVANLAAAELHESDGDLGGADDVVAAVSAADAYRATHGVGVPLLRAATAPQSPLCAGAAQLVHQRRSGDGLQQRRLPESCAENAAVTLTHHSSRAWSGLPLLKTPLEPTVSEQFQRSNWKASRQLPLARSLAASRVSARRGSALHMSSCLPEGWSGHGHR